MSVLIPAELMVARHHCAKTFAVVAYTKPQINAALQAIENTMTGRLIVAGDVMKTIPQIISSEIDAATTPFVFTNAQKRVLFALWADLKFQRDK